VSLAPSRTVNRSVDATPAPATAAKGDDHKDYFSIRKRKDSGRLRLSPGWPALSSIAGSSQNTPVPGTLNSQWGKGSWSSLFYPSTGDRPAESIIPPIPAGNASPISRFSPGTPGGIPVPRRGRTPRTPELTTSKLQGLSAPLLWNSWAATRPSPLNRTPVSFSSAGHRRQYKLNQHIVEEKSVISGKKLQVVKIVDSSRFVSPQPAWFRHLQLICNKPTRVKAASSAGAVHVSPHSIRRLTLQLGIVRTKGFIAEDALPIYPSLASRCTNRRTLHRLVKLSFQNLELSV
jgi:hypothetical protein